MNRKTITLRKQTKADLFTATLRYHPDDPFPSPGGDLNCTVEFTVLGERRAARFRVPEKRPFDELRQEEVSGAIKDMVWSMILGSNQELLRQQDARVPLRPGSEIKLRPTSKSSLRFIEGTKFMSKKVTIWFRDSDSAAKFKQLLEDLKISLPGVRAIASALRSLLQRGKIE